ncbi:hypothetical protein [Kribbella yunnanensis]|uniref:hypothetical protein n=1 Tax=Kribbella yunnanensis TaxID=190194 RepID=UPI0031DC8807
MAEALVRLAKVRAGQRVLDPLWVGDVAGRGESAGGRRTGGEIARVLTADGRAVLLTEDKRLLRDAVAGCRGVKVVRERVLRFNGATPTVFVVMPTRRG